MSTNGQEMTWEVGERVAYYSPHAREPDGILAIQKVYKTGHIVVNGLRFRTYNNTAHKTGDGYSKAVVKKLTPEIEVAAKRGAKRRRIADAVRWLELVADPNDVPDEALKMLAEAKKRASNQNP